MNDHPWKELLVDRDVHYLMEVDGQLVIVEKVPARVNPETGEKLFSPKTVQRLRELIQDQVKPARVIETPVYKYSA